MKKASKIEISQVQLREVLDYNPDTGIFRWKIKSSKSLSIGETAGCTRADGYVTIQYNAIPYLAHRLAWVYTHGELPSTSIIDHVDGNPSNNKLNNIRVCAPTQNQQNRRVNSNSISGFKGVSWVEERQKWKARTWLKRKYYFLGYFDTKEDAIKAHQSFCITYHGEFYRDTTKQD
jgi:hypothetical protein